MCVSLCCSSLPRPFWRAHGLRPPEGVTSCGESWEMLFGVWYCSNKYGGGRPPTQKTPISLVKPPTPFHPFHRSRRTLYIFCKNKVRSNLDKLHRIMLLLSFLASYYPSNIANMFFFLNSPLMHCKSYKFNIKWVYKASKISKYV